MYLETVIDQPPHLHIIYHYHDDASATLLETTWHELDRFCAPYKPYELTLEHYDAAKSDVSQRYLPTDLKTWIDQLPNDFKTQLLDRFIQYCQHCQTSNTIKFFH